MLKLTDEQKALIKSHGHLFTNTGGNDIVELIERPGVSYFNNAVVAELQGSCLSQLLMLQKLLPAINKLRSALEDVVGASTEKDLQGLQGVLLGLDDTDEDRVAALAAIDTLLETLNA